MSDMTMIQPLTMTLAKVTLAAGTTTTLSNTGTTHFAIKGLAYSKAAMTNVAAPSTDAATGAAFTAIAPGTGAILVVGFNAAGTLLVAQGPSKSLDGSSTSGATALFVNAPDFPSVPDTMCPIGYISAKIGSAGAAWTFGTTTNTSPANCLISFADLVTMPARPVVL